MKQSAAEVAPADGDLARRGAVSSGVVAQAAAHAPGNANGYGAKDASEMLGVEERMRVGESSGEALVLRARPQSTDWLVCKVDWVVDDPATRGATRRTRAAFDEGHDRFVHLRGRAQEPFMHAKLRSAEAHHHVAIAREPTAGDRRQPELTKTREEIVGGVNARRYLERKRQLRRIVTTE